MVVLVVKSTVRPRLVTFTCCRNGKHVLTSVMYSCGKGGMRCLLVEGMYM